MNKCMMDFPNTSKKDFAERNFGDFAMIYGVDGTLTQQALAENTPTFENTILNRLAATGKRSLLSIAPSVVDFSLQGFSKSGKFPYYGGSQPNKAGLMGLKWFLNPFVY